MRQALTEWARIALEALAAAFFVAAVAIWGDVIAKL